ncbi:MAG: YcxB family protein [Acidobacteria bacterium]|nr:YcxB family protein [Acidobacteriota bacterium]
MEEIISLRFKYTEEEYVSATRFYLLRVSDFLFQLIISSLLIVAGVFSVLLLDLESVTTFILIFVGVIWLLVWLLALFVMPRQRFRSDPKFRDEYSLQFSDDGIQFKTSQIDALIQWSLYTKVLENDRFYLLIYGKNMISVIPKRAFTSADQEAAFDALLRTRLLTHPEAKRLNMSKANEPERTYVPPTEPPDWR